MPRITVIVSLAVIIAATSAATRSAPPATKGSLSGMVVDAATGSPLNGASVAVKGTALRGSSDGNGVFFIDEVPLGPAVLEVSRVGYKSRGLSIGVTAEDRARWTIALTPLKH
ncbi:MAG: carboxypeptidase-like regulatory domain-containing protein [Gemmatimonadota bacterium]|nr:carboxypeptidase-like regulatory domain-containing protein [Gemmatimonadota bacterium]